MVSSLRAQDYCSLIVKVVDPTGREVEARVSVVEQDGHTTERDNRPGGVKFCGLGIKPVSVVVGHPACNQVTVRNVSLDWNETTTVHIIYDRQPCLIDRPPVAACEFLFRVVDSKDTPLGSASLKMIKPFDQVYRGDRYGRILVRIAAYQTLDALITAKGYMNREVSIRCISDNQSLERRVTLEREERQPH